MASVWSALQASDLAVWINLSRWVYAGIATVHVLGIAVFIGAILTLDLRLMGFGKSLDLAPLARFVVPVAATGLCCAIASGALLFIGRAADYSAFGTFQIKMALLAAGLATILVVRCRYGRHFERAARRQQFCIGIASICLWLSIATAGRMIAYVHG